MAIITDKHGIVQGTEPSDEAVKQHMKQNNQDYYNSREQLRELEYGGKPPHGYQSWGDYWKSL